jgi:polyhydroxybutyrate depolymerase
MIVLHGGLGNAKRMEEMTGMNDVADTGRFIVAYPEGTGGRLRAMQDRRTWNAGSCCGQAVAQNVDDVSFIEKMIEDIHSRYSIDSRRVYVAGMSNGAMMAYRLACQIPDKIAAVIAVSGTLAIDNCDGAKDVPVLHIHGDQDTNVPFMGGRGERSVAGVDYRSVPDTIKLVTRARQCLAPEKKTLEGNIEVSSYRCSNGAPVELYVIKGGGHVWPGGHGSNNKPSDGRYISASKAAWEFAKQFSKGGKR